MSHFTKLNGSAFPRYLQLVEALRRCQIPAEYIHVTLDVARRAIAQMGPSFEGQSFYGLTGCTRLVSPESARSTRFTAEQSEPCHILVMEVGMAAFGAAAGGRETGILPPTGAASWCGRQQAQLGFSIDPKTGHLIPHGDIYETGPQAIAAIATAYTIVGVTGHGSYPGDPTKAVQMVNLPDGGFRLVIKNRASAQVAPALRF